MEVSEEINNSETTQNRISYSTPFEWFTPSRFGLMLALALGVAYADVLFGGDSFFYRDFGSFGYPLAHFYKESFWTGEIPLWNPYNNCGLPFMAQWNTLVFYPGSLLYLLLPLPWSLNFYCLAHLWFAGLSMYFLAHRWTSNRLAAAVAGVAFSLNGLALNSLMWPNNVAALAWMPLVVLSVEAACESGGRKIAIAALVGAIQMLSGAPEIILFTWTIAGVVCMTRFFRNRTRSLQVLFRYLAVVMLVAGLAALQLLPFLDLLTHSQREVGFSSGQWAMPGTGWGNLLIPLFRTYRNIIGIHFQDTQFWTTSYYLGIGVLALATWAALRIRNRRVFLLAGLTLVGLILSLGNDAFLYKGLRTVFPQLDYMQFPVKFIVLAVFAVPLLAAYAVNEWFRFPEAQKKANGKFLVAIHGALIAGILFLITFSFRYPHPLEEPGLTLENGLMRVVFLTLIVGAFFLPFRLWQRRPEWIGLALLAVLALDALTHAPRQNPSLTHAALRPGLPVLQDMQPRPALGQSRAMLQPSLIRFLRTTKSIDPLQNFIVKRTSLRSNVNLLDKIPKIDGFYSLYLKPAYELWRQTHIQAPDEHKGLYDFMSVSQFAERSGKNFRWRPRSSPLPLATIGQRPVFVSDDAILEKLTEEDFDPKAVVYLPDKYRAQISASRDERASVVKLEVTNQRIDLETETQKNTMLVLAQNSYHPWKAFIDGKPAEILRVNHAFQALEIPQGSHQIKLVYQDRALAIGCAISMLSLGFCGLIWRKRQPIDRDNQQQ